MSLSGITAVVLTLGTAIAAENGRARADWISESTTCEPGKSIQTAIRMVIDPGWHIYWVNPGDAGMKTSIEWKLPAGWVASSLRYPVPERFVTGDLAAFGYEGTVLFPVTLTAPPEFAGSNRLEATVSWLACNDGACIPGKADVFMEIQSGPAGHSPHAGTVSGARSRVPVDRNDDFKLEVSEQPRSLVLRILPRHSKSPRLLQTRAFPISPDVIPPTAEIRFQSVPDSDFWEARVPKSEYATSPIPALELVLAVPGPGGSPQSGDRAISLAWRKSH